MYSDICLDYPYNGLPAFDPIAKNEWYFNVEEQLWIGLIVCIDFDSQKEYITVSHLTASGQLVFMKEFPERANFFYIAIDDEHFYRVSDVGVIYIFNYKTGNFFIQKIAGRVNCFQISAGNFCFVINQQHLLYGKIETMSAQWFVGSLRRLDHLFSAAIDFDGRFLYYKTMLDQDSCLFIEKDCCQSDAEIVIDQVNGMFDAHVLKNTYFWYVNNTQLWRYNQQTKAKFVIKLSANYWDRIYSNHHSNKIFFQYHKDSTLKISYFDTGLAGNATFKVLENFPKDWIIKAYNIDDTQASFLLEKNERFILRKYTLSNHEFEDKDYPFLSVLNPLHQLLAVHPCVEYHSKIDKYPPRLAPLFLELRKFITTANFWNSDEPQVINFLEFLKLMRVNSRKKYQLLTITLLHTELHRSHSVIVKEVPCLHRAKKSKQSDYRKVECLVVAQQVKVKLVIKTDIEGVILTQEHFFIVKVDVERRWSIKWCPS